jgi:hypothetical protein
VSEAHNEARSIGRAAHRERERLFLESKRIQGMLRAALGIVESETAATSDPSFPCPHPSLSRNLRCQCRLRSSGPGPWRRRRSNSRPRVGRPGGAAGAPTVELEPEIERGVRPRPRTSTAGRAGTRASSSHSRRCPTRSPEPEARQEPAAPVGEPALQPTQGGGSREFDWGE